MCPIENVVIFVIQRVYTLLRRCSMAIPKLKKQNIIDALKFIDENGVPEHNTSVKYVLVSEDGKNIRRSML